MSSSATSLDVSAPVPDPSDPARGTSLVLAPRWRLEPAADAAGVLSRLRRRAGLPLPHSASPATALVGLCDLGGSVALAEVVSAGPIDPREPTLDDGTWLGRHVGRQLASLERWLDRQLADPHKGRNAVPRVEALEAAFQETPPRDAEPGRGAFERTIAAQRRPWEQRTLALLRVLRRDARRIRAEMTKELRRLGPRAGWLERLDAALRKGTLAAAVSRDEHMAETVGNGFEACLRAALAEPLADGATRRYAFLAPLRADADALVRAILTEERALIMHLVAGCVLAARNADRTPESPDAEVIELREDDESPTAAKDDESPTATKDDVFATTQGHAAGEEPGGLTDRGGRGAPADEGEHRGASDHSGNAGEEESI